MFGIAFFPSQLASAPSPEKVKPNTAQYEEPLTIEKPPPKPVPNTVLNNCYLYAKSIFPTLPPSKVIWQNLTDIPVGVAVFSYSGVPHYAVVTGRGTSTIDIVETNFKHGKRTERTIALTDPALKGFYLPIAE